MKVAQDEGGLVAFVEQSLCSIALRWSHVAALAAPPFNVARRTYNQGVVYASVASGYYATRLALEEALEDVGAAVVARVLVPRAP